MCNFKLRWISSPVTVHYSPVQSLRQLLHGTLWSNHDLIHRLLGALWLSPEGSIQEAEQWLDLQDQSTAPRIWELSLDKPLHQPEPLRWHDVCNLMDPGVYYPIVINRGQLSNPHVDQHSHIIQHLWCWLHISWPGMFIAWWLEGWSTCWSVQMECWYSCRAGLFRSTIFQVVSLAVGFYFLVGLMACGVGWSSSLYLLK